MQSKHWIVILLFAMPLSGCAPYMAGTIESTPDPSYSFDKSAAVLITVVENSSNSLRSRYYTPRVAATLKRSGFQNVYTDSDKAQAKEPFKIVVFVSTDTEITSYQYRSADYGPVTTGATTNCNSYGYQYGYGTTTNCTTTPTTSLGIVGYSDKTSQTTKHYFSLSWYDVPSRKEVLSVLTSSSDGWCTDEKIYDFLANQTFGRMSFTHLVNQNFRVQLPDESHCR